MIYQIEIELEEGDEPSEDDLFDWIYNGIKASGGAAESVVVNRKDGPGQD